MLSQLTLWEPLQSLSKSFSRFHDAVATLAQVGILPGVAIQVQSDDTSEQLSTAHKQQKDQDRKQQLALEAKQIIAKLGNEGCTLAFTEGSPKQHPKVGWVARYGCVVMGVWETHPARPKPTIGQSYLR